MPPTTIAVRVASGSLSVVEELLIVPPFAPGWRARESSDALVLIDWTARVALINARRLTAGASRMIEALISVRD
jgi:hypothetical protein